MGFTSDKLSEALKGKVKSVEALLARYKQQGWIVPDETAGDDETIINDEAAPETPAPAPAQAQPAAK